MKLVKFIPYFLILLLNLSGCSIISNLDELSVMGDYSREKDNQHRLVKEINDHYDALSKIIAQSKIKEYRDESSFVTAFGDPILKKVLSNGTERWLYRYAIYRFARDKVYVYFDRKGKMINWEQLPCTKFF